MISAPVALDPSHDTSSFDCGEPSLNAWLRTRAEPNQRAGASRTYVACEGNVIVGYHAIAAGSVSVLEAPGRIRRNMPNPIPALILGRLAVSKPVQGLGLGRDLLNDALYRALRAAEVVGIRCVIAHAIDERATEFYARNGFQSSPISALTMMLPIEDLRRSNAAAPQ